jgi:hypothetical protein
MTLYAVKINLGLLVIFGKLSVVILILAVHFINKGFLTEELTTTIGLVTPIFASSVTAIVAYFLKDNFQKDRDTLVAGPRVFITFLFPVLLTAYLISMILLKINYQFNSFENFKAMFIIGETSFGIYFAQIMKKYFLVK